MTTHRTQSSCIAALLLLAVHGTAGAQPPPPNLAPVPEPPPLPEPVRSGEVLEPDVTIIQRGDTLIHEYRIRGRLYAIRVFPENAPPYYLVDTDGDGDLDTRGSDLLENLHIPQWVLFSW